MNTQNSGLPCSACRAEGEGAEECPEMCGECCLRDVPDGASARVRELRGQRDLRSRLYSLGLTPGTEIIMHGRNDAGCRIQVRDTCVVLDCDSARNVMCDAVGGESSPSSPSGKDASCGLFGRGRRGRGGGRHA